MNIGQAAEAVGLPVKTLRYYEEIGLVCPDREVGNAYRHYSTRDIADLRFIQRARVAGFSLEHCRLWLQAYRTPSAMTPDMRESLPLRLNEIDAHMRALQQLKMDLIHIQEAVEPAMMAVKTQEPLAPAFMPFMLVDSSKGE